MNDPNYDYRAAYLSGITPKRYAPDGGAYHWPSVTPEGKDLKSKDHPTYWMEEYMKATGRDPNEDGVTKAEWERMKASQTQ